MKNRHSIVILGLAVGLAMPAPAADWAGWRGPSRDGRIPDFDAPKYGASASPLAADDLLVVHLGSGKDGALTRLDPASGGVRWSWTRDGPAYASPILSVLDGVSQIITQSRQAVVAVAADSGELLWEIPFKESLVHHNAVTPAVHDGLVVLSGKKRGIWAVRPRREGDSWRLANVWRNDDHPLDLSSPVIEGSRIFGLSHLKKGRFFALDAASGKAVWTSEGRAAGNAALLTAPGIVLALTTDAELMVLDAGAGEMRRLTSYRLAGSETWAHPAIADGGVFVKDADSLTLWAFPGESTGGGAGVSSTGFVTSRSFAWSRARRSLPMITGTSGRTRWIR